MLATRQPFALIDKTALYVAVEMASLSLRMS